jgi:hypothetical protein
MVYSIPQGSAYGPPFYEVIDDIDDSEIGI